MLVSIYKTKKELKASIGKEFIYNETSAFGPEWRANEVMSCVGPDAYNRKFYSRVTVDDNNIIKVVT